MIILAIDQSLCSTGYAVLEYEADKKYRYTWGRIKTSKEDGEILERMNIIIGHLARVASENEVDYIVLERPIVRNGMKTAQDLAGLYYVIASKLMRMGFSITTVVNTTWKKGAGITGKDRKEQKESSMRKAYELLEHNYEELKEWKIIKSDDEADAICMAWYWAKEVEKNG